MTTTGSLNTSHGKRRGRGGGVGSTRIGLFATFGVLAILVTLGFFGGFRAIWRHGGLGPVDDGADQDETSLSEKRALAFIKKGTSSKFSVAHGDEATKSHGLRSKENVGHATASQHRPSLETQPGFEEQEAVRDGQDSTISGVDSSEDSLRLTTIDFVMSHAFAHGWKTSSERLTFPTKMRIREDDVLVREEGAPHNRVLSTSAPVASRVIESKATATFYGKSSLRIKYTTRRSLDIVMEEGFDFGTSGQDGSQPTRKVRHYLLLSLWEDEYRLSYISSIRLLRELGLFHSNARLVELRCGESLPDEGSQGQRSPVDDAHKNYNAGGGVNPFPNGDGDGAERAGGDGGDALVYSVCGPTMGIYLMLEYPSDAIIRAVEDYFTVPVVPDSSSVKEGESLPMSSPKLAPLGKQRVCESDAAYRARMASLKQFHDGKLGAEQSATARPYPIIGARNWMYFEKPSRYDLLDIPSFQRNSTISPIYRQIESMIGRYSSKGLGSSSDNPIYFDLDLYLNWVAFNTLVLNGDYDDEAFIYGVGGDGVHKSATVDNTRYYTVMAWDYDSVFGRCHRGGKGAVKSDVIFCGETPFEKLVGKELTTIRKGNGGMSERHLSSMRESSPVAYDYLMAMKCILTRVATVPRWRVIMAENARLLEVMLQRPHVRTVTYAVEIATLENVRKRKKKGLPSGTQRTLSSANDPMAANFVSVGAEGMVALFAASHRRLQSRLVDYGFMDKVEVRQMNAEETSNVARGTEQQGSDDFERLAAKVVVVGAVPTQRGAEPTASGVRCADTVPSLSPDSTLTTIRKTIEREYKHAVNGVHGWLAVLTAGASGKVSPSVRYWLPDGTSLDAKSAPGTFGDAGLYCASVSVLGGDAQSSPDCPPGNEDPDMLADGVLRALVPFVVRDKARGKAEFATPSFSLPTPLSLIGEHSYQFGERSLGAQAKADTASQASLSAVKAFAPTFWYGGGVAPTLPDDSTSALERAADPAAKMQGRRYPVVLKAIEGGKGRRVLRENVRVGVSTDGADVFESVGEPMLIRGHGVVTVMEGDIGASRKLGTSPASAEGPFLVVPPLGSTPSKKLTFSVTASSGQNQTATIAGPPAALPTLADPRWTSLEDWIHKGANDIAIDRVDRRAAEEARANGDFGATPADGDTEGISSAASKEGTTFLLVDDRVVNINGRGTEVTIPPNTVIVMRGAKARIVVGGGASLTLMGTAAEPIMVMAAPPSSASVGKGPLRPPTAWDTLLVNSGGLLKMSWCFVTGSGVDGKIEVGTGKHHTKSTAVTVVGEGSKAVITDSVFVYLRGAAFSSGLKGSVEVADTVVQWAELGIECVLCDFTSRRSTWALFPSWTAPYADNDNDAMYLSGGAHVVADSVIAHTKDDGIDTGTPEKFGGGDGGSLLLTNSIIEMVTHEAVALSSASKGSRRVLVKSSLLQHAQQGVEMGYSGGGLLAAVTDSVVARCAVGARYGDNYRLPIEGSVGFSRVLFAENQLHTMNYLRKSAAIEPRAANGLKSPPSYLRRMAAGGQSDENDFLHGTSGSDGDGSSRFAFDQCANSNTDGGLRAPLERTSMCYRAVTMPFV